MPQGTRSPTATTCARVKSNPPVSAAAGRVTTSAVAASTAQRTTESAEDRCLGIARSRVGRDYRLVPIESAVRPGGNHRAGARSPICAYTAGLARGRETFTTRRQRPRA